ncbi:hypothetical protein LZ32DRAFT_393934 [Colletotrichum eremochloae]|nr:hypothetical protein LZ32DRAFT_393934 [Colletotrichum eremochloae]
MNWWVEIPRQAWRTSRTCRTRLVNERENQAELMVQVNLKAHRMSKFNELAVSTKVDRVKYTLVLPYRSSLSVRFTKKMTFSLLRFLVTTVSSLLRAFLATLFGRRTIVQKPEAAITRSLNLRVDNIPVDHVNELDRTLRGLIKNDAVLRDAATTLVCRSIAQKGRLSVCATLSIKTSLCPDDLVDRLYYCGRFLPFKYSSDFEGITVLHDEADVDGVDIIVVPGIGTHAFDCWMSTNNDDIWIRDFLRVSISNVRILLCGPETGLTSSTSTGSIETLGGELLEQIIAFRNQDRTSHRPLLFVAHSLGGLLVKQAFVHALADPIDANRSFFDACCGLVFFGVPNLGVTVDSLRALIKGQPKENMIRDVAIVNGSSPPRFLKQLAREFADGCKGHFHVMNIHEKLPSPIIALNRNNPWNTNGSESLLVTKKSAISTGLDGYNTEFNTNHCGLIKFESEYHSDYTIVTEFIRRQLRKPRKGFATQAWKSRWDQRPSQMIQMCLIALAFDDMDARFNEIADIPSDNFEWLSSQQDYVRWKNRNHSLLLIVGEPQSGKSTMMKLASRELKSSCGPDTKVFRFFFHRRGSNLQKTSVGFFRALLHQIIASMPEAAVDLIEGFSAEFRSAGKYIRRWKWCPKYLRNHLDSALLKVSMSHSVVIIVDALDECCQGDSDVIELFRLLLSRDPGGYGKIGICVSARLNFRLVLNQDFTFKLDACRFNRNGKLSRNEEHRSRKAGGEFLDQPVLSTSRCSHKWNVGDNSRQILDTSGTQGAHTCEWTAGNKSIQVIGGSAVCELALKIGTCPQSYDTEDNIASPSGRSVNIFTGHISGWNIVTGPHTSGGTANLNFGYQND